MRIQTPLKELVLLAFKIFCCLFDFLSKLCVEMNNSQL